MVLQQNNFIVDDGVDGYMDNGMDNWGAGEGKGDITDSFKIFTCEYRDLTGHLQVQPAGFWY